ncbi:hypothetical protein V8E36_002196 [Tilletia maclaganii]
MTSIIVTNVAGSTTKDGLNDFFSYCGAIRDISLSADGSKQKAEITFEKASAATTASMLSGGSLDGADLEITLAQTAEDTAKTAVNQTADAAKEKAQQAKEGLIGQEDKPRVTIVAEYLAQGYVISDEITKRAIDYDKQHGYSERFTSWLQSVDRTLGEKLTKAPQAAPTEKTKDAADSAAATSAQGGVGGVGADPSLARQVQAQATQVLEHPAVKSRTDWVWSRLSEYYNSFINHPRIHAYYTQTTKTVQDVHEEAKRIKEEKQKSKPSA